MPQENENQNKPAHKHTWHCLVGVLLLPLWLISRCETLLLLLLACGFLYLSGQAWHEGRETLAVGFAITGVLWFILAELHRIYERLEPLTTLKATHVQLPAKLLQEIHRHDTEEKQPRN